MVRCREYRMQSQLQLCNNSNAKNDRFFIIIYCVFASFYFHNVTIIIIIVLDTSRYHLSTVRVGCIHIRFVWSPHFSRYLLKSFGIDQIVRRISMHTYARVSVCKCVCVCAKKNLLHSVERSEYNVMYIITEFGVYIDHIIIAN